MDEDGVRRLRRASKVLGLIGTPLMIIGFGMLLIGMMNGRG